MTVVYKMAGVRFDVETECTEFVPNERTVYESEGGVSSTLTWTYEGQDGSTRVTMDMEYQVNLPGLRKLGEAFLTKVSQNEGRAILGNVKAKMEL
jgi:serine protease inhibitor